MRAFFQWLGERSGPGVGLALLAIGFSGIVPGFKVPFIDGRYGDPVMTWNAPNAALGVFLVIAGALIMRRNYRKEMGGTGRWKGI